MTTKFPPSPLGNAASSTHEKRRTKHSALTDQLREFAATLRPGDRFPAQDELMRRYGVSDSTVLRSLQDLQRGGWIVRSRGKGTFVADFSKRSASAETNRPAPTGNGAETKSRTIILLARHFFAASYLRLCADFLSQQAEAQGYSLVCRVTPPTLVPADLSLLENDRSLGFVLMGYSMAGLAGELIARGHRAVVMGTPPAADTEVAVPCVCADHDFGGYLAARHLLDNGHKRIAFAYDSQMRFPYEDHPRWIGHCRAVAEEAARQSGNDNKIQSTVIDPESLALWRHDAFLADEFFRRPDAPTAIAAWNDSIAVMLLGILHRAGRRVPDDVSVIGFDALPEGMDCIPPLTSVDQHVDWQVQTALRLLTRPTPPPAQTVVVLPEIKVRASCGPPPLLAFGKEKIPAAASCEKSLVS